MLLLFTTSCGDDEASTSDQGQMSAFVDGTAWDADMVSAVHLQNIFNISGINDDGTSIIITLDGLQTGEYVSNATTANVLLWSPGSGALGFSSQADSVSGKVVITQIDDVDSLVSGTFSFTAAEPSSGSMVEVTEGVFTDVRYTSQTPVTPDNSLQVKINGGDWEAASVTGIVNGGTLTLSGTDADASETVALTIPDDTPVGTYDLGSPLFSSYGGQYNADDQTFMQAFDGSITIANHDQAAKIIEGNFSFNAGEFGGTEMAALTEGSFYVAY